MVEHTLCIPCQYGDHGGHYEVIQAVPEGMLGGRRCPCNGECEAESEPEILRQRRAEGGQRAEAAIAALFKDDAPRERAE